MTELTKILLWLHFLALGMGMGGGIALSQVGRRLVAATPEERETWWPLHNTYARIADGGLVLLLITGPLILWFRYAGAHLGVWFQVKMGLVVLMVALIGLAHVGSARLKRGDEAGGKLMTIAGPLIMLTVLGIVLTAVLAFN